MFVSGEHRAERRAAKQMHVQVIHHLPAMLVAVDDEPEAILRDAFLPGDVARHYEHVAERGLVFGAHVVDRGNRLVRHDQHVHARLRTDVAERGHALVALHDGGRYLPGDDLLEYRGHDFPAAVPQEYAAGLRGVDGLAALWVPVASRVASPHNRLPLKLTLDTLRTHLA